MNRRRVFNKLGKIFMVMTMILSMCFSAGNTKVNAWDGNVPHEFTRVKNIKYPKWWGRKIASLKQWSTYSCKYNGQWSYCLESSKKTPSAGNYTASVIENNSMVRKLLYYGFGGPAAWDVFGPNHDLKTAVCPDDSYLSNDDVKYLLTHIFLSGAYSGDWNGFSEELFNQTFGGSYGTNLMNIYRGIEQLPDPSNGANFSTGNTAKFTATYDKANSLQKTNTVKFNASSSESVQLPLQNNVTIHIAGTSNTKTGGTATVYGGQSFYLTTPATNPLSNYQSGNLTSSAKGKFCALAISDGNGASQTHGSWYQETADTLKYSVEWMGFGYIDLKKTSANPDMTNNSRLYSLEGAKYGIYEGDSLVQELTTDVNGYAKSSLLLEGKYTVKEISASKGYDVDQTSHGVTVTRGQTVTTNVTEKPKNDPVALTIVKNDAETLDPQGGANLAGAEFTVKYYDGFYTKDNLPSKATRTWILQTVKRPNGLFVANFTTIGSLIKDKSDDLYYQDGMPTLPLGTISIEETKAPEGYFLKGAKLNVTDTTSGTTSSVIDGKYVAQINEQYHGAKLQFGNDANQMIVQEKVKKQRIQLFKSGEREGISGVVKGLQGAEFTWKLKTEVDNVGWDNAKTYAVITTNENGRAITDYLPYGKYLVRETKTPKDYMTAPDFTVSVTKDSSEYNELEQVKLVSVNNKPFASYVKLVKVDEDTGKKVTLNSASFKIKDAQGNYVVQKVSGTKVDTFTTNSDNEIIPVVEKGTVTLPLMLNAGTYTIEEIKTPKGFLDLEKPVEFVISSTYDYDVDEDADPIVEVKIRNRQPKGEIKLNKTVMDLDTDTDLVDRSDLSKIQFVLKAKEDIYSSIDGSLMFEKDSVITTENSGAIVNTGNEVRNGIYALSLDGHLDISNLPMSTKGASYYLQEVKTLDGCVLDTAQYDAVFKQSDFTTKNYIKSFDVENKTTDFEFNKTDVTGDKEVEGAQLTITDEDGNVVDQWTSDGKVHSIEGLVVGKTYTLSETVTAKDYVKATDIKFTVKNSSELEKVTMKDKQVFVSKTTVGGEEVTGAHMQIIDEDGNIIDEWYSEGKSHIANGLEEGKTYTLHEDLSPLGFNLANDFTFEVTKEKENQTVEMVDTVTEVNKTDVDGKAVKEATLSIVSEKTKNIVDQWVTGKHILDIDKDIKSQLEENGKAEGTYMDEEDSMVMFSIAKNKDRDDYTFMQVKDGITTYSNIDLDGNETTHRVQGLVAGEKYILRETKTPEEYVQAKEIEFTAGEDEDQTLVMQDKQVSFTKTDVTGEKEVEGATITVKEKETDKIVDEWISGKEDHKIKGLEERKTYILSEIVTPEDYVKATDIEFTVTEEKVNQEVNMKDKQVKVSKTTAGGDEVVGASMQIRDEFGNIIDEWISDGKEHYATGLVEGKKYILHEDLAPAGLNLANDIEFEVSYAKENQKVEMIDTINEVSKVDEKGNLLKGAEMTVTSNKTKNIIDKWISGQHIFDVTDEMKSQLKETGKAEGMYVDNEDSTVQYSIAKNKGKDDYTVMFVEDGITTYTNIDLDGNETRHMIQGLEAGEEYVLKETKTPDGYATFKTQTFTAEEGKDTSLSMVDEDTKGEVSKQDITTKKELEGAKLKVTDKDGKVIDEWTSGKQPHMIKNLTAGETYTLTEVIAPKNYKIAESLRFTVKDTGKIQRVIMYDRPVNNYVETGDENNYCFILMLICMIFIGRLLKSYLNNFID
ncbi:SpaA isopeptide-forming pilin-related protein [Faecalibacillus faecis]|uniref:SpaA isopeptide-forming pilin-related protein n=1 Tax=Faecalibacillus faecis TaxID=1982628 RepID=UPI0018A98E16|nr:SpaA isopeptide-forming pilin-related protein [Faecalibacillus faecis]